MRVKGSIFILMSICIGVDVRRLVLSRMMCLPVQAYFFVANIRGASEHRGFKEINNDLHAAQYFAVSLGSTLAPHDVVRLRDLSQDMEVLMTHIQHTFSES